MARKPQIPGGAFQIARKIFTSSIWTRDPNTFRLFIWILGHVNFADTDTGNKGELLTTHAELANALITHKRGIPQTLSVKQIRSRLKWLQGEGMIQVSTVTAEKRSKVRGLVRGSVPPKGQGVWSGGGIKIVVVNFDTYQTLENYKVRGVGRGVGVGGESAKGQTSPLNYSESLTKSAAKNVLEKCVEKEEKDKPSLSSLRERYPDQDLLFQTLDAIRGTRKSGRVADSVLIKFFMACERHPVAQVEEGFRIYLAKDYAGQGRDEKYLAGIIRNLKGNEPKPTPSHQTIRSTARKQDRLLFEKMARRYREASK